jgi:hypothetical protein
MQAHTTDEVLLSRISGLDLLSKTNEECAFTVVALWLHDVMHSLHRPQEIPSHDQAKALIEELRKYRATTASSSPMEAWFRALIDDGDADRAGALIKTYLIDESDRVRNKNIIQKNKAALASRQSEGGKTTAKKRRAESAIRKAVIDECRKLEKKGHPIHEWAGRITSNEAHREERKVNCTPQYARRIINQVWKK